MIPPPLQSPGVVRHTAAVIGRIMNDSLHLPFPITPVHALVALTDATSADHIPRAFFVARDSHAAIPSATGVRIERRPHSCGDE